MNKRSADCTDFAEKETRAEQGAQSSDRLSCNLHHSVRSAEGVAASGLILLLPPTLLGVKKGKSAETLCDSSGASRAAGGGK